MGKIIRTNIWDKPEDAAIELEAADEDEEQWIQEVSTTVTISTSRKYWGVELESLRRKAAEALKTRILVAWPNVRVRIVPFKSHEENVSHGPLASEIDDWVDDNLSRALKDALGHGLKEGR